MVAHPCELRMVADHFVVSSKAGSPGAQPALVGSVQAEEAHLRASEGQGVEV